MERLLRAHRSRPHLHPLTLGGGDPVGPPHLLRPEHVEVDTAGKVAQVGQLPFAPIIVLSLLAHPQPGPWGGFGS